TAAAGAVAAGPAGALLDLAAARRGALGGPEGVVRRHGCSAYAPLVGAGSTR
ncbi:radical SAM protein, partial [Streptomyces microflavus]